MSGKTLTPEERAAVTAEILSIIDRLNPDYQKCAFLYAQMLTADSQNGSGQDPDPADQKKRFSLAAYTMQQRYEAEAADPQTSAERRDTAKEGARLCGILHRTLQESTAAAADQDAKRGDSA